MQSYIAYKNKINETKNTAETIGFLEKIAASTVPSFKKKMKNINEYVSNQEYILNQLQLFYKKNNSPLVITDKKNNKQSKKMIVILTSDKGLVGGLWYNMIDDYLLQINQYQYITVVGNKGINYLKKKKIKITKSFDNLFILPHEEKTTNVINYIMNEFQKNPSLNIDILYPQYISIIQQKTKLLSLFPLDLNYFLANKKSFSNNNKSIGIPIFEPSKKIIFQQLIKKYILSFLEKIFIETELSELSARTVSMEQANLKTKKIIKKITLQYIKQRRRILTQRQVQSFIAHKTSND